MLQKKMCYYIKQKTFILYLAHLTKNEGETRTFNCGQLQLTTFSLEQSLSQIVNLYRTPFIKALLFIKKCSIINSSFHGVNFHGVECRKLLVKCTAVNGMQIGHKHVRRLVSYSKGEEEEHSPSQTERPYSTQSST